MAAETEILQRRTFLVAAAAGFGATAAAASLDWPSQDPRTAGFDPARLQALREELEKRQTKGLLILRSGHKVLEWYAPGVTAATRHGTASLAKAMVGGTSLLVAMNDGLIRPTDRAAKYIPGWANDPLKSKITIRQLATHTSGIQDSSVEGFTHGQEPDLAGTLLAARTRSVQRYHPRSAGNL